MGCRWLIGLASLAVAVCGCDPDVPPPSRSDTAQSTRPAAPQRMVQNGSELFTLPMDTGHPVTVKGPAALFFFTSWCGYCKQAIPEVRRMAAQAEARGWRCYAIDDREGAKEARWFNETYKPGMPVLYDTSGSVARRLGVNGYPTFVLIDAQGRVVFNSHAIPQRF